MYSHQYELPPGMFRLDWFGRVGSGRPDPPWIRLLTTLIASRAIAGNANSAITAAATANGVYIFWPPD